LRECEDKETKGKKGKKKEKELGGRQDLEKGASGSGTGARFRM
jgi:hypothetical protein